MSNSPMPMATVNDTVVSAMSSTERVTSLLVEQSERKIRRMVVIIN